MFCQSLALGLLGSRVAYALKESYTLVYFVLQCPKILVRLVACPLCLQAVTRFFQGKTFPFSLIQEELVVSLW